MGSPVSVTVANLVVEEIEETALASFQPPPQFWKRYVDDTCTALPRDSVSALHSHLNSVNKHIQFTVEEEKDGTLPFLDVLLTRSSDGTIETSVYRKKTHKDRYLDFAAYHPLCRKKSVVRSLLSRAKALLSTAMESKTEERRVSKTLRTNGFPASFIRRAASPLSPTTSQQANDAEEAVKRTNVTLPYVQGLSESIKRILTRLQKC